MLRRQQDGAGKNAIGWRLKIRRRLASSISHGIRLMVFMNEAHHLPVRTIVLDRQKPRQRNLW